MKTGRARTGRRRVFGGALVCLAAGLQALISSHPAVGQGKEDPIPFISMASGPYEKPDLELIDYLRRNANLNLRRKRAYNYRNAINEVLPHEGGTNPPYVARLTPYPCIAAELLGAKFEILGTYSSRATKALTYYSYFVVNKDHPDFPPSEKPSLREVDKFLKDRQRTFLYHDKFSTSSYFIPLNYFRKRRIFEVDESQTSDKLTSIKVIEAAKGKGGSDSIKAVRERQVDLAAVWDGTKNDAQPGSLLFIPIEPVLPNDLLVVSAALPDEQIDSLRKAIHDMRCGEQGLFSGDFRCWHAFEDTQEAREALAGLRRLAVEPPAPATIRISLATGAGAEGNAYLEAARQAVRLAGTEFVLHDPDYHQWVDLDWKLRIIHDGAIELTSAANDISGKKVKEQKIRISFADAKEELTRRIVDLIHTRLNRIRYVCPFENSDPTILRDVGFTLKPDSRVWVQQITWIDPERNDLVIEKSFEAEVSGADAYKFLLDPKRFEDLKIDPMSNSAFRVILERPTTEKPLFQILTVAFVALFALGGALAGVDLYRTRGTPNVEET